MVKTFMTGAVKGSLLTGEVAESAVAVQNSLQLTTHKLNEKNYLEWARTVKLIIDGKGKLRHLTGEVKKPVDGDSKLKAWRSENSMITTWLINSMEPVIRKPFLFIPTVKKFWEAVRDTYSDLENPSLIFELKTRLWNLKQGDKEVTTYYNEKVTLWQELDNVMRMNGKVLKIVCNT